MSTYSNFFSFRDTSHASPSKLFTMYPSFCFFSRLVSTLSLSLFLFLSRPHSHSNLFERIIHARVMLEMHSREEGSAAIHRVWHSLYFIFLFIFYSFFPSRYYSTHCGCAYFLSRGSPMQIAIVLDISAVGTGFQIFAQVHIFRTRCELGNGALVIDTFYY